jgi:vacuolar-type H+-ATPase subunit E/Vma4
MGKEYLVERIKKDADEEAKTILANAKAINRDNLEFAKKYAEEQIKNARVEFKKRKERESEITASAAGIRRNIELLKQKTDVVDSVFQSAFGKIKYNWRVEKHPDYEEHLTREVLLRELRTEIEPDVVKVLFE